MTRARCLLAVCVLAGLTLTAAPAAAQFPDTFTNLQVLPKDMPKAELQAAMRGIALGLGVRCSYCHVEREGGEDDFAADDKPAKQMARTMLRMTRSLNADYVSTLPAADSPRVAVTCATCHRGSARPPRPLDQVLADVVGAEGTQAGIAKYRAMKASDVDSGQYDFRERTLVEAAGRLRQMGKVPEAIAFLQAARDLFPASAAFHASVAQFCLQHDDLACAEAAVGRALELDPANQAAVRAMETVKKRKAAQP